MPYKNTIFINLHPKTICVGTSDRGLFLFKMTGDKLSYVSNELPGRSITYTASDNEGNIWISTYNDGLYCMSPRAAYQIPNIGIYNTEPLSVGKLNRELLIGLNRGNIKIVVDNIPRKKVLISKNRIVLNPLRRVSKIFVSGRGLPGCRMKTSFIAIMAECLNRTLSTVILKILPSLIH